MSECLPLLWLLNLHWEFSVLLHYEKQLLQKSTLYSTCVMSWHYFTFYGIQSIKLIQFIFYLESLVLVVQSLFIIEEIILQFEQEGCYYPLYSFFQVQSLLTQKFNAVYSNSLLHLLWLITCSFIDHACFLPAFILLQFFLVFFPCSSLLCVYRSWVNMHLWVTLSHLH